MMNKKYGVLVFCLSFFSFLNGSEDNLSTSSSLNLGIDTDYLLKDIEDGYSSSVFSYLLNNPNQLSLLQPFPQTNVQQQGNNSGVSSSSSSYVAASSLLPLASSSSSSSSSNTNQVQNGLGMSPLLPSFPVFPSSPTSLISCVGQLQQIQQAMSTDRENKYTCRVCKQNFDWSLDTGFCEKNNQTAADNLYSCDECFFNGNAFENGPSSNDKDLYNSLDLEKQTGEPSLLSNITSSSSSSSSSSTTTSTMSLQPSFLPTVASAAYSIGSNKQTDQGKVQSNLKDDSEEEEEDDDDDDDDDDQLDLRKNNESAPSLPSSSSSSTSSIQNNQICLVAGCGQIVGTEACFDNHMQKSGKVFTCTVADCKYLSPSRSNFKIHIRKHTGEKPYICDECSNRYKRKENLNSHKSKVHILLPSNSALSNAIRSSEQISKDCPLGCGQTVGTNECLNNHMQKLGDYFVCKVASCDYLSKKKEYVKRHIRIRHIEERPYLCDECFKRFKRLDCLTKHIRIHTKEKPYVCDLCDKRFSDFSNLRQHKLFNQEHKLKIHKNQG